MPFDLKTYDRPDAIKPYKGVFARADAREKAKAPVEVFASLDGGVDYVYIYGEIGGWGVWADDVIPLLEQIDGEGKEIEIRLQTNGGEVFEGQAIAVAIKRMKAKTVGVVYGYAASMGSVILSACDEKKCFSNSAVHVHAPSGGIYGNAEQIRQGADVLDKIRDMFAGLYAAATNGKKTSEQVMTEWLAYGKETWFTPLEAVAEGIIDIIIDEQVEMNATASFEMTPPKEIQALFKVKEDNMTDKTTPTAKADEATTAPSVAATQADADATALVEVTTAEDGAKDAPKALTQEQMGSLVTAAVAAKMPEEAAVMISKGLTEQSDIVAHLFDARATRDTQTPVDNKSQAQEAAPVASLASRRSATRKNQIAALSGTKAN